MPTRRPGASIIMTRSAHAHPKEPNPSIFQTTQTGGTDYLIGLWFVACLHFPGSLSCFALFRLVVKTSKYVVQEYARLFLSSYASREKAVVPGPSRLCKSKTL